MRKWLPTTLMVLALFLVGFALFQQTGMNMTYYFEVDEVDPVAVGDRRIKISGIVAAGTVRREAASMRTWFEVTGPTRAIEIEYTGTVPDIFQPGIQVVAEGAFREDGVFAADDLLAKCPSKYDAAKDPADFKHLEGHPTGGGGGGYGTGSYGGDS